MRCLGIEQRFLARNGEIRLGEPVAAAIVLRNIGTATTGVLLGERKEPPYKGRKFPPGGTVEKREDVSRAAIRELREETGIYATLEDLYPISTMLMGIYPPDNKGIVRPFYPFHILVWRSEMGKLSNLIPEKTESWEWVPLFYSVLTRDARIPNNIAAILQHVLFEVIAEDKAWFRERGLRV